MRRLASVRGRQGFTLMEIAMAFMVLALGVSSVLGVLAGTVTRERAVVMRTRIVDALPFVEDALRILVTSPGELTPTGSLPITGFPDLTWSATFTALDDWPDEVLARIAITWQLGGEAQEEVFLQIYSRNEPFVRRATRILTGSPAEGGD